MSPREFDGWAWLAALERGHSSRKIAESEGVSIRTVQALTREARRQLDACRQNRPALLPPRLHVFYGCRPLTPRSACVHGRVPIPEGDAQCCGICHRSGLDHLPYFHRDQ